MKKCFINNRILTEYYLIDKVNQRQLKEGPGNNNNKQGDNGNKQYPPYRSDELLIIILLQLIAHGDQILKIQLKCFSPSFCITSTGGLRFLYIEICIYRLAENNRKYNPDNQCQKVYDHRLYSCNTTYTRTE